MATDTRELTAVRVRNLHRTFSANGGVLNGLDLDIAAGEFVALIGRSGTGKSTLLRALAGLDRDVDGYGRITVPESVSVVFQDSRLLPWKRVLDNVVFGLRGGDAGERGRQALAEVGLAGRERAWPYQLSGGEQQRAAIARALANAPKLLLADEPTGNLDPHTSAHVFHELLELIRHSGVAALIATHNLALAKRMHRVLVLEGGRLQEVSPASVPV